MIGVSTLMTMAQGRGAKTAQHACWQPLTREWAKFTGPNISVMKTVSGTVKKPKPYSNLNSFMNGCNSFPANG